MNALTDLYRHLLGKKSWNVYNADNIAKVKRDEDAAAARETAEEQRMQEVDAERRIQTLRGIRTQQSEVPAALEEQAQGHSDSHGGLARERKRRRIAGEDDTDRDIRLAQEMSAVVFVKPDHLVKQSRGSDAPLLDSKGHINLFPVEGPKLHAPKNKDAEAETSRKKKKYEDQYTMRFSNAAGFKQSLASKPWYQTTGTEEVESVVSKDVWGNEDSGRKEREKVRITADDPLALIEKGVKQLREVEKERELWRNEREEELHGMALVKRKRKKKRDRRGSKEELEDFRLEDPAQDGPKNHKHRTEKMLSSRRRGHRSRSCEPGSYGSHRHRAHDEGGKPSRSRTQHTDRDRSVTTAWKKASGSRYSVQFAQA